MDKSGTEVSAGKNVAHVKCFLQRIKTQRLQEIHCVTDRGELTKQNDQHVGDDGSGVLGELIELILLESLDSTGVRPASEKPCVKQESEKPIVTATMAATKRFGKNVCNVNTGEKMEVKRIAIVSKNKSLNQSTPVHCLLSKLKTHAAQRE